jgi:hypothetical protein
MAIEKERPTPAASASIWVQRQLTLAVYSALAGLVCVLLFLWYGFGAWTMGLGTFVGIPLLGLAVLLYVGAVVTELKQRGAI